LFFYRETCQAGGVLSGLFSGLNFSGNFNNQTGNTLAISRLCGPTINTSTIDCCRDFYDLSGGFLAARSGWVLGHWDWVFVSDRKMFKKIRLDNFEQYEESLKYNEGFSKYNKLNPYLSPNRPSIMPVTERSSSKSGQ
jgi:hypothetical protein